MVRRKKKNGPRKTKYSKGAPHPVEVVWTDATGHSGWLGPHEIANLETVTMVTVGFLVSQNAKETRLLRTLADEGHGGDLLIIPSKWVQSLRKLK